MYTSILKIQSNLSKEYAKKYYSCWELQSCPVEAMPDAPTVPTGDATWLCDRALMHASNLLPSCVMCFCGSHQFHMTCMQVSSISGIEPYSVRIRKFFEKYPGAMKAHVLNQNVSGQT